MKSNDLGFSVGQARLLKCAEIVRNGTEKFSLDAWKCGSARCAVGDYALKTGAMALVRLGDGFLGFRENFEIADSDGNHGWEVVESHFSITRSQAKYLFHRTFYEKNVRRAVVADRIEQFALHEHADAKVLA